MICDKLPTNKDEILGQLKKNKVNHTRKEAVTFLMGVQQFGCWNEQKVPIGWFKDHAQDIRDAIDSLPKE